MSELWVVRHGETAWSAAGRHTSSTDLPLTPAGEEQARALAPRLARHWDLVLCSPLQRARRTAELAGVDAQVDPDLREWEYGEAEGRTTAELSREKPWNQWDCPLGESLAHLAARVRGVLERLPEGDVLLVAHGHVLRVLTAVYLGLEPIAARHFVLGPGRVGVLGHEHTWPAVLEWST